MISDLSNFYEWNLHQPYTHPLLELSELHLFRFDLLFKPERNYVRTVVSRGAIFRIVSPEILYFRQIPLDLIKRSFIKLSHTWWMIFVVYFCFVIISSFRRSFVSELPVLARAIRRGQYSQGACGVVRLFKMIGARQLLWVPSSPWGAIHWGSSIEKRPSIRDESIV